MDEQLQDILLQVWMPTVEHDLSHILGMKIKFGTLDEFKTFLRNLGEPE